MIHTTIHAANHFTCLEDCPFEAKDYSRLKFGSDKVAKRFGRDLAHKFFAAHSAELLSNRAVIIPSPYNHVKNAASIMTQHFADQLNHLLVMQSGEHAECSFIHRKISYISDYGFLGANQRRALIDGDDFYFNVNFYKDKLLIFVDDVRITGTHEYKLHDLLNAHDIDNRTFFLYYGMYEGNQPDIESKLNFAGIKTPTDFFNHVRETCDAMDDHFHMIVRPIKYILGKMSKVECADLLQELSNELIYNLYTGCIGEGYYKIPDYQENFSVIREYVAKTNIM